MSEFSPTKEQELIFKVFKEEPEHILINAIAGSGKTSTLMELANRLDKRFIMICFNSSIQKEIQGKLDILNRKRAIELGEDPETFRLGIAFTMHSLGLATIKTKTKVKVDNYFYYRQMLDIQKDPNISEEINDLEFSDKVKVGRTILDLFTVARMFNTFDLNEIEEYMTKMAKPIFDPWNDNPKDYVLSDTMEMMYEELCTRADKNYSSSKPNIDFTDMLHLPHYWKLDVPYKPTYLFMDECQDFNLNQHHLIDNMLKQPQLKKAVSVGDPKQCQPTGTKITLSNGTSKNIEDIQIGDKVVSYDAKLKGGFVGYLPTERLYKTHKDSCSEVLDKAERIDFMKLYKIECGEGITTSYTGNHKCLVKFNSSVKDKYCVYLMRKDSSFRIGIYKIFNNQGFGLRERAAQAKADAMWILDVLEDRTMAYILEQQMSMQFGIAQIRFIARENESVQSVHDFIWNWASNNRAFNLLDRATKLLNHFNRELDYPIWDKTKKNYLSIKSFNKVHACNLIPEIMDLAYFDPDTFKPNKSKKAIPVAISNITIDFDNHKVYSLKVSKSETYVADNLATHNSIYGFAGALNDSFDRFKAKGTFKEYPLSVNFRSSKAVVTEVNKVYDIMTGFKEEEGTVLSLPYEEVVFDDNCMILCRNKAPLVEIFMDLLTRGQSPTIKGMDILTSFRSFIQSNKFKSVYKLVNETTNKILKENKKDKPSKATINSLIENLDILDAFSTKFSQCEQILQEIDRIKDMKGDILLSTIHKSKGLEHKNVYIYDEKLIPSKYAETDIELEQEENLRYVARSRAKTKLVYVHAKKDNDDSF